MASMMAVLLVAPGSWSALQIQGLPIPYAGPEGVAAQPTHPVS
jgi:hypothetical protein